MPPPPASFSIRAGLLLGLFLATTSGCASIPQGRAAVDSIEIVGARTIDPNDVLDKLASAESSKFLGLMRGVAYDYSLYDPAVLQRDLARVERYYRGRGFFEAHVRVARVVYVRPDHVRIGIAVEEGAPVKNREVRVDGIAALPKDIGEEIVVEAKRALPIGARFDEEAYAKARTAVTRAMTDRGYAYASVSADAQADLSAHAMDYVLTVAPGIPAVFGAITFNGLDPDGAGPAPQEINEKILRQTLHIRAGAHYSTAVLESGTQALLDLEVFSAVHIVPGLSDPPSGVIPLLVQVQPTKLRAVRLGFGAEFDAVKTDVHGIVGWEDHNFLGGLRDVSVDFTPGVVLYPTTASTPVRAPRYPLPEERLRFQLRQPAFLEDRTTGFVRPELNVFPLLVEANQDPSAVPLIGYVEAKIGIGVERRFGKHFFVTLSYNVQDETPFRYPGPASPDTLPDYILLSFPQLITKLDLRDDPVHTHAGFYASNDIQVAGGPFGGTATDVRIQPELQGYVPIARGVTFAVDASFGFLFPVTSTYGRSIENLTTAGNTLNGRDVETMYFRGFFAGGPSSDRGYPLRQIAPHGVVPFLTPANASMLVALGCDPTQLNFNSARCSTPVGGFTMWEATAEVRFDVSGPFGAAVFCDAGDVSQHVVPDAGALRFDYLHLSCGVGGRYETPVGPIRLDIGYRIQPLQRLGFPDESAAGDPTKTYGGKTGDPTFGVPPTILKIPIAFAFGIGEAF